MAKAENGRPANQRYDNVDEDNCALRRACQSCCVTLPAPLPHRANNPVAKTQSNPIKPSQTQSNPVKPSQTRSKAIETAKRRQRNADPPYY